MRLWDANEWFPRSPASGGIENNVDHFVEISEQATAVEASAPGIVALFRAAGIRIRSIKDMDAWLRRHAVFITAISGALCKLTNAARAMPPVSL